ncbi:cysteine proteinase [Fomitiporia mediterranea MF3/22]|uniref:cysteine proteinase n=1 Tax=Fomitiporia mediterranea (strain MF3/22) TaxID=694068 RepID=UPI0004409679|nr:cysteine proteinase [Fomitiporia mediterranea MF3/22]EJD05991.1 cysteine proteinase [Fomitiporia mediterranea MF3/22]
MKLRKRSKLMAVMTEQLRKAAEHAARFTHDDREADARIEQEARHEEKVIKAVCDDLGLIMYEINPDGHCLYAAIADQLRILNILPPAVAHYGTTRAAAAAYMFSHPDAFLPFLPSTEGEDGVGAGNAGLMSPRQFHSYCENVRSSGMWGGEPEILALSRAYRVPIHVVQSGTPPIVVHDPDGVDGASLDDKRVVRISYHRRMYGLGEHYNSLRPKSLTQQIKSIFE